MIARLTTAILISLLLAPPAAICGAAESPRPAAQPSLSLPAKADLPDVGKNQAQRYNVLFIAVDDLNDWVGCLVGNAQVITPNSIKSTANQINILT